MKIFFTLLTVVLIFVGFVNPFALAGAAIAGFIAVGVAPSGRRADGKRKTGGLLGGLVDDLEMAFKKRIRSD